MRVKKEKYLLTEIANEFIKADLGNELTLLECLREGQLKAFTMFPAYYPRPVEIPVDYWENLDCHKFTVATYKDDAAPETRHQQAYLIEAEFAFEEESKLLDTMVDSIEAKDIDLMNKEYKEYVIGSGINIKKLTQESWKGIIKVYGECRAWLDSLQSSEYFPVYVWKDDWVTFASEYLDVVNPISESLNKLGRKETELWLPIYAQIITRLIREPSSANNLKKLSRDVDLWIKSDASNLNKNAAPKHDRIYQKLLIMSKGK